MQVAQNFDVLRFGGLKSERKFVNMNNVRLSNGAELFVFDKEN